MPPPNWPRDMTVLYFRVRLVGARLCHLLEQFPPLSNSISHPAASPREPAVIDMSEPRLHPTLTHPPPPIHIPNPPPPPTLSPSLAALATHQKSHAAVCGCALCTRSHQRKCEIFYSEGLSDVAFSTTLASS